MSQIEVADPVATTDFGGKSQVGLHFGDQGIRMPDYTSNGPFSPASLPRLEHTCSSCFPQCVGDQCRLKIDITYPKVLCQVFGLYDHQHVPSGPM